MVLNKMIPKGLPSLMHYLSRHGLVVRTIAGKQEDPSSILFLSDWVSLLRYKVVRKKLRTCSD